MIKYSYMFDLVIIGGGPAGAAAAVYAARKQLKTLLLTESFGGQSVVSSDIQNWIGTPSISGMDLAKNLEAHVRQYAGECVTIVNKRVEKVEKTSEESFIVHAGAETYTTRTVLVATGSTRRRLEVPGADEYEHKGLTYCATCDGPLYAGQDVVVIGGGNAGFESAAQLLAYAKSVTLLHYRDQFKADPVTVEKVLANPHMTGILNAETTAIKGDKFVTGLTYKDTKTGEEKELATTGVFIEIGLVPQTSFVAEAVRLNEIGQVEIDPWNQRTSTLGIWAAGDCTNGKYHQNNIAAGDAVKALEDIYKYLRA